MGKGAETKGEHGSSAVGLAPRDGLALFRGYEKGYETGMVKGMEVGYEKGMSKGMEKGYEKGIEMGYEEGQAFDKGYFKGMGKGMEKGYGDGYDKGYEKGRGDGKSQGMEMGFEQGSERGYDRGYENGLLVLDQALKANEKGCLGEWLRQKSHWTRHSPPKSKRARSQWPRSPRPSSSEADLEAELEEKPSPKPRPRLSQLDSAKANKSEDTSKAITEVSPKDYEWLPEEDLYEPLEEYFRMQNEDVGIEYSTDRGDLSPTAPYEPAVLPSQLGPRPPSDCPNCSTGFMRGFAEQHWEDHLRQPSGDTVPRTAPARLQDLAETWYAETLSMRRGP